MDEFDRAAQLEQDERQRIISNTSSVSSCHLYIKKVSLVAVSVKYLSGNDSVLTKAPVGVLSVSCGMNNRRNTMPDELNYSAMRLVWDIVQSAAVLALFIWTVIDRKRQGNTEGIDELKKHHQEIDRRVQKLEDGLEHLPTHHDLNAIKVSMASLTTQIQGMDHKLETIHQFLLSNRENR